MASKGLESLAPNGLKSQGYTVSNYPRENLTAGTRAILDALASNPATANIGVKSGYRSPTKNATVGGAKRSQHMLGNAIDLDIAGLPESTKKAALDTAIAAGAKGIGVYASGNSLHVDPRKNPTVWGQLSNAYKGMSKKQFDMLPGWARTSIDALFGGVNPQPNPALPETMQAPQTLAQVQAQEAIAQAYRDPLRALDVLPSRISLPSRPITPTPPSRLTAAPVGQVTRSPLAPALPSYSGVRPSAPTAGALPAAPAPAPSRMGYGTVNGVRPSAPPSSLPAAPARSLAHPVSAAKPSNLAPAPVGQVTKGAPLAPASMNPSTLAAQYAQYQPSKVTSMPTVAGMPAVPAPTGLPAAKAVATPLQHPISVPAVQPPPAPVLAPALAPPQAVKSYNVAEAALAPAAPAARAYDVYSGLANEALDNTGKNTVARDAYGNTTVTNEFGATTAMTPGGYQSAYGKMGALPGISAPNMGKIGATMKGAVPGIAGSALGGLLGGPIGALFGGLLAREVTKPGGLFSNQVGYQTDYFGTINAAKPQGGLGFPGAPSGGYGTGGGMGASFSNNSAEGMRGISPGAADAIDRGVGGLY